MVAPCNVIHAWQSLQYCPLDYRLLQAKAEHRSARVYYVLVVLVTVIKMQLLFSDCNTGSLELKCIINLKLLACYVGRIIAEM